MITDIDFEARYTVDGWRGIAFYLTGYVQIPDLFEDGEPTGRNLPGRELRRGGDGRRRSRTRRRRGRSDRAGGGRLLPRVRPDRLQSVRTRLRTRGRTRDEHIQRTQGSASGTAAATGEDSHDRKADIARAGADSIANMIPMGQPILVGHHSERRHRKDIARIESGMRQTIEHGRTADEQRSRAENIKRQLDESIYDDADAIERLTEKLAALEAQREQRKAANSAYRKEHRAELKAMSAYERGQAVPFPSYAITNLGGNISRTRERLARLQRERDHGPADRMISLALTASARRAAPNSSGAIRTRYNRQQGARCITCEVQS